MHMHAILWQFECKILCTYINVDVIYHHLDAVCLVERKNYEFFAIDLLPVCLSTCHDSETFNFLCCATYINLAVHLSKVSILCLYFMYIYRCICYESLNVASCSQCSIYNFYSLNRLFFWVKWKIQLAIDIEVWEFVFGIKRFLME